MEIVFMLMININNEISNEWANPPEGYNDDNQDDEDQEITNYGMNSIDRLISSIGENELFPVISKIVN